MKSEKEIIERYEHLQKYNINSPLIPSELQIDDIIGYLKALEWVLDIQEKEALHPTYSNKERSDA